MARDLAMPWETLKSAFFRDIEGRENKIEQLMDWAIEYLGQSISPNRAHSLMILLATELPDSSESASTLKRAMSSRQHILLADTEEAFEKFKTDLR